MLGGYIFLDRLVGVAENQSDAAVALLLVAPSLLTAYLVQPGEHPIASRVLRPLRYLVALSALSTYVVASMLVLGFSKAVISTWWLRLTQFAVGVSVVLLAAVVATVLDLRKVKRNRTEEREIVSMAHSWER
jgi:hypothetical protein